MVNDLTIIRRHWHRLAGKAPDESAARSEAVKRAAGNESYRCEFFPVELLNFSMVHLHFDSFRVTRGFVCQL
jgi:hypothetical protein